MCGSSTTTPQKVGSAFVPAPRHCVAAKRVGIDGFPSVTRREYALRTKSRSPAHPECQKIKMLAVPVAAVLRVQWASGNKRQQRRSTIACKPHKHTMVERQGLSRQWQKWSLLGPNNSSENGYAAARQEQQKRQLQTMIERTIRAGFFRIQTERCFRERQEWRSGSRVPISNRGKSKHSPTVFFNCHGQVRCANGDSHVSLPRNRHQFAAQSWCVA